MTSSFEKRYVIDNSREADGPRERDYSIELSDQEHLERLRPLQISKPPVEEGMSSALKEKFEKARKITKDTKSGKKDAKGKSKSPKSKAKSVPAKSNTSAVARIQEKL